MIDLHVHSIFSDGKCDVKTLFQMAENNKLDVFSITDHDTIKTYKSDVMEHRMNFSGQIITGCEVIATTEEDIIELLTFGIDIEVFEKFLDKYFSEEVKVRELIKDLHFVYSVADKLNLKYDRVDFDKLTSHDKLCKVFNNEIARHEENKAIYMQDAWKNNGNFDRRYVRNPNSEWYIDKSNCYPTVEEVIKEAHKAGGLTFMAHPLELRTKKNIFTMIRELKSYGLDGIEVYHVSATTEEQQKLREYAHTLELYISGGSDFHGVDHPTKASIVGTEGNVLNIENEIIDDWITRIKTL